MNIICHALCCIWLITASQAAIVNFAQTSVNDVDSSTISAVTSSAYLNTGSTYSTVAAPAVSNPYSFTHWTNSSYSEIVYRDAWGRSLNPISFILLENTTCTAHYLPTTRDSDTDGIADWFEIEYYGNLDNNAASDTDDDGSSLLVEFQGGHHPLYANSNLAGGVSRGSSGLVTANLSGYPSYTLTSVPAGTVDVSGFESPGTVITSPDLTSNPAFGYWTLNGVRQSDAWGVARPQLIFTMGSVNRVGVAYLFPGDSDADGVPDAWEQYYYNSLAYNAGSDTDGDGHSLLAEYQGGNNPRYATSHQAGGVSTGRSGLVTANIAGYPSYTLSSNPAGSVNESAFVPNGTVVTTPNMDQSDFGYWTLDGVQQRDAWGAALRQLTFTLNGGNRAAVARLFTGDTDSDGIPDAWEKFHFQTMDYGAQDAPAGGSWTLLTAYQAGVSPLFPQNNQPGGVSWTDSSLTVVNLQPYQHLSRMLVGGILTNFFSFDPHTVTGIQAGTWSSTAMADWDGDGDFDLFVAHEDGLRVFRNIGTAYNPNFEEIMSGFSALSTFIAGRDRPIITGGDWNGDGLGDLVIGGNTATIRLVASTGAFGSGSSGLDLSLASTRASPALGDMNGDGRSDLLVLLDSGAVTLFLHNGTAVPFSGSGIANFLGSAAPSGTSIACGDINQDGLPDVLLADNVGRIWEFIKSGNSFSLQSKAWGGSYSGFASGLTLASVDIEGDGDLDLIGGLANGGIIGLLDPNVGRPTGLIARPGADSVQLEWNPSWQSRIRGYHVYRANAEQGPFGKLNPDFIPLPNYLDSPVAPTIPHHYYVTGVSQYFLPGNSAPHISESLPSDLTVAQTGKVILSVRPIRSNPGQMIRIKLSIDNAMGVAGTGMQMRVNYDPTKLTPKAQATVPGATVLPTGLSRNLVYTDNGATANGELIINATSGPLEPGNGKLFTLQFVVASSIPKETPLGVEINGVTMFDLNGKPLAIEILPQNEPESNTVYFDGDVNGDEILSAADKQLLSDLTNPDSRAATAEELMAGDLNGDGKLDFKDLVLIMQLLNTN